MLNSEKQISRFARQKKIFELFVLSEKKILNETKKHNPPFKLNGRFLRVLHMDKIMKTDRCKFINYFICFGGLCFFVSFRIFFSDNTKSSNIFFCRAKREICFSEFNIRLYDKNSESYYFVFLHQNQNICFSNIGNQNICFRKKP
jgi:hypothetical protein